MVVATLSACSRVEDAGVPVLGGGAHTMDAVQLRAIDGIGAPTDLAFHPEVDDEIWAVGPDQDAVFVITDAHGSAQVDLRTAEGAEHFLSRPVGLAFGEPGRLATIQDQDEVT